jgi:hypothetical protein
VNPWVVPRRSAAAITEASAVTRGKSAIGDRQIRTIRREDIKEIIAPMTRPGLSASRISQAHLVINAVFNETVRNKKLAESPCTDIPVPGIARAADFILPDGSMGSAVPSVPLTSE